MIDPNDFRNVFGKTWVDKQEEPLLSLGGKQWTRYQLVSRVGVGNYKAVAILMDALQRMGIQSLKDLAGTEPMALAAIKGVGVTTLFVTMSLLEAEGFNVKEWYDKDVTFQALKRREEQKKDVLKREMRRAQRRRKAMNPAALAKRVRRPNALRELRAV